MDGPDLQLAPNRRAIRGCRAIRGWPGSAAGPEQLEPLTPETSHTVAVIHRGTHGGGKPSGDEQGHLPVNDVTWNVEGSTNEIVQLLERCATGSIKWAESNVVRPKTPKTETMPSHAEGSTGQPRLRRPSGPARRRSTSLGTPLLGAELCGEEEGRAADS